MNKAILLSCIALVACGAVDDGSSSEEALGDPNAIDVGFNMGHLDQFGYLNDFYALAGKGPRLCHTYARWNVANEPAALPDSSAPPGSRPWLVYWLEQAKGRCDEVLISFKAQSPASPPSPGVYENAFRNFVNTSWPYQGKYSFTPWNEPNNQTSGGNGLGQVISAHMAAEYYLTAEEICQNHGCVVAAGDFASNGDWWRDFAWNCADDNVAPGDLCKQQSSVSDGSGSSYLDRYKNYIANYADGARTSELGRKHHLKNGFRPARFAYHGWHDVNGYLAAYANHHEITNNPECKSYDHCATRMLLKSLGGSWGGVEIWDTEVGVDQDAAPIPDAEQACGAAFLVNLHAVSPRIKRVYYTRLHGGSGELYDGAHVAREAAKVIAHKKTSSAGCH